MLLSLLRVAAIALACTAVCAGGELASSKAARPNPVVTVQLASGRLVSGEIDPQTDADRLLLRWSKSPGEILSSIDWHRVVRAEIDGLVVRGSDLRDTVAAIRRTHPKPPEVAQASHATPLTLLTPEEPVGNALRGVPGPSSPRRNGTEAVPYRSNGVGCHALRSSSRATLAPEPPRDDLVPPPAPDTRVRSLAIEAALANWDAGTEVDGLILLVAPLDASGSLTPVHATIEVELTALRITSERALGIPDRVARWTQTISPEDFGPRGAVCRLPFQGVHPAFDCRFKARGALHVRLSVPGQGVLEASEDVRVRPYSAFRDHLEQATGRRYLTEERARSR